MNIDPTKFVIDESRSNPKVAAMQYPDCPIKGICSFVVVGFGSVIEPCQHLKYISEDEAECLYDEPPVDAGA